MRFELTEIALLAIVYVLPLLLGFGAKELFKGIAFGGSAAFLGALIFALLFEGWNTSGSVMQAVFLNSASVVPIATLLALLGYLAKRLLQFVRGDHRAVG
jgi:hypothetical protein